MPQGYLALVLHAHLPFVRHPEHEESLEENWLYEALTETYLPLLLMMDRLNADGVGFRLTFSITPTLASMWSDELLQTRYLARLDRLIGLGAEEKRRTRSEPVFHHLASMYQRHLRTVRAAFVGPYRRDLVGAFRRLQEQGAIEIIASAATHAYLPALSAHQPSVRAQVRVGVDTYRRLFGCRPRGFWLPECGFAHGVDSALAGEGIRYSILETHGVTRAVPRPKHGVYAPVYTRDGLAFFGRDPASSKQVWSSTEGYPGDFDYREFYRDIGYDLDLGYLGPYIHRDGIRADTGYKYYRITGGAGPKEVYIPRHAHRKVLAHARHFLSEKNKTIARLSAVMDRKPLIVAPYDAELFGHWWFEGPRWLEALIRLAHRQGRDLRLVTLSEYLDEYPVNQVAEPAPSSWGHRGFSEVWQNRSNDWIYRHLHQGGLRLGRLAGEHRHARGLTLRALTQAARELLLAQASDWAFMINSGAVATYATQRIKTHLLRLDRLWKDIGAGTVDRQWLSAIEAQDNIFPDLDYRVFSPKRPARAPRRAIRGLAGRRNGPVNETGSV